MHQRQLTEIPREVLLRIPAESEGSDAGLVTPLLSIPHLRREKQPISMPPSSQGPGWGPRRALHWCWHHRVTWSVQETGLLRIHSHSDLCLATLLSTSLGPSNTGADARGHKCKKQLRVRPERAKCGWQRKTNSHLSKNKDTYHGFPPKLGVGGMGAQLGSSGNSEKNYHSSSICSSSKLVGAQLHSHTGRGEDEKIMGSRASESNRS